jgi:predicted pyridoxine 5'-phosphate oxidase superfamily flavin-nucleotide-binding protein
MASTFHPGEQAWHVREGIAERMAEIGPRAIRDFMPDQHRELFEKLPFVLLGTVDSAGRPRALLVCGPSGFIRSPDARTLELHSAYASDPDVLRALTPGVAVGLLGIEPHTRRRNRANGYVVSRQGEALVLRIAQSFGNCPKHITPRRARFEPGAEPYEQRGAISAGGAALSEEALRIVRSADTFFIASAASASRLQGEPPAGADVSHRGGAPGFVDVQARDGKSVLIVPDYQGNYLFNTLGNLTLNPQAALLFMDFDRGDVLEVTVRSAIVLDPERVARYPQAQRLLELRVASYRLVTASCPLLFDQLDQPPSSSRVNK